MSEPLEATLRRLQEERERADRLYNDALTALDRALRPPSDLPPSPPDYDEHQITPLNDCWNILPAVPDARGLAGRLTGLIWRTVGPYLQRQLTFNSRLVDHLNRNVAAHRESRRVAAHALAALREHMAAQAEMQGRLMVLLQQITSYVDTRDRDTGGRTLVLNAALSTVADGVARRAESTLVRVERVEGQLETVERDQRDLRTAMAASHRAIASLTREIGRAGTTGPSAVVESPRDGQPARAADAFAGWRDAHKYVGFEDQFRGSEDVIRERLASYVPLFAGAADVLDVGCGRGEFIALLLAHGITARGIDVNSEMVEICRGRGLDVREADVVGHLATVEDDSLGGLFAAQVVEHLEPAYLLRFLDLAFAKLRPGARMVLETLNPACWVAFFDSYIRDITHVRPLHPETLKYLVLASGFPAAAIEYRSPVPESDRLQHAAAAGGGPELDDVVEVVNANVDRLNARLFTHLDYAVVAEKTAGEAPRPA